MAFAHQWGGEAHRNDRIPHLGAPQPASTTRQAVSLESQWLAAIVEGSDDAIISKTMGGIINYWNAAATRIFGYTAEEMIGSPITRIIPVELQTEEAEILAKLGRGERIDHFETVRLDKNGRRVTVSVTVSPLRNAAGDISELRRSLATYRSARRMRTPCAAPTRRCATRMKWRSSCASRRKTPTAPRPTFSRYEPRNPHAPDQHQRLRRSVVPTKLTRLQRRYVKLVRVANAALLTIVNDILDFSKVEAGRLELECRAFSPRP